MWKLGGKKLASEERLSKRREETLDARLDVTHVDRRDRVQRDECPSASITICLSERYL